MCPHMYKYNTRNQSAILSEKYVVLQIVSVNVSLRESHYDADFIIFRLRFDQAEDSSLSHFGFIIF